MIKKWLPPLMLVYNGVLAFTGFIMAVDYAIADQGHKAGLAFLIGLWFACNTWSMQLLARK